MKRFLLFMMSVAAILTACDDDVETTIAGEPEENTLEVSEVWMTFLRDGEEKDIEIKSNQQWEITIEDTEWLTSSVPGGVGDGTVTFAASPFDAIEDRSNLVTIKSETFTRIIQIRQLASDPQLDVDKTDLSYKYAGGKDILAVTSNTDWEIVIDEEDNWITADSYIGTGDAEVTLTVPLYYGTADRSATVTLRSEGIEKHIEISQKFPLTVGVWILSEAGAMQTSADLAYYDMANDELKTKYYSEVNGETLGQVANFMILYGSKMYISISGEPMGSTSCVRVVDYKTGELLSTIDMKGPHAEGDVSRQMTAHDGKIYVTSYFGGGVGEPGSGYSYYGGVARIDTASMAIEAYTRVGDKPEGIAYHSGKLFVCNNEQGRGKTMSIVDVASFEQEKIITVPENPVYIKASPNGDLYFGTPEVWISSTETIPSAMHQLNPETYAVRTFGGARASRFAVTDKYIYTGEFSYSTFADVANRIDRWSGEVTPIDLNHAYFMLYSFDVNPVTGDIYMGGQGDDVIFMSAEGEKLKSFKVGVPYVNHFIPVFE